MKEKFRKFQFEVLPYLAIPFFISAFILAGGDCTVIPNTKLCPSECICWKCMYHEIYDYCCSDTKCNVDCPEDGLGQKCPKFQPIHVQTSGLNK